MTASFDSKSSFGQSGMFGGGIMLPFSVYFLNLYQIKVLFCCFANNYMYAFNFVNFFGIH